LTTLAGFPDIAFRQLPRRLVIGTIKGYQWFISPLLPGSCRFYPTCSRYAIDALARHGLLRGTGLAIARILRCHPWGDSKFDPVPGSGLDPHNHDQTAHESHESRESCGAAFPEDDGKITHAR